MMTNHGNRITQGQFSFLPDLTDEQITAQIKYALKNGWAVNVEYTDDPHPRNTYWEMFGMPMFDLKDPAGHPDGDQQLPQDLPQPLHPRDGVRQSRRGVEVPTHVVHRQPAQERAGLSAWCVRKATDAACVTPSSLCHRQAGRRAVHLKKSIDS